MNKRKLTLVFVWLSAIATILSFLAWFNNLVVLWRWAVKFLTMTESKTSASTQIAGGCFKWLDWTAVDLSAVTTFIPFFGFAFITLGFWRIYKNTAQIDDDFPFFRAYDRINISLGLIGTLVGIIIIGFYDMDKVTMGDLMMCLHTALFSTLIAVGWVFIIVLLFTKPFMRWWYSRINGILPGDSFDDRFLERLEQSAASIRHELSQSSETLNHFSGDLKQASGSITALGQSINDSTSIFQKGIIEPLLNLQRNQTDQSTALNQFSQTLSHIQTSHQTLVELLKEFKSNNASLQSHLDSIRADHIKLETVYQQSRKEVVETRQEADATRNQLTELQRLIQEKQAQFDTQLAEWNARRQHLEQTTQTLITEQVELKAALEEERIRANESEKTLAKIKSIF
ncbi:MAG: hypothetical protein WCJ02_13945 [bacterium]